MSDDDKPGYPRPRQVTMGAWVAGGSSAAMLLVVVSVMGRLRTVDFRESVASFLRAQRDTGITLGVDDALLVVRVALMVIGAVAAAILVFAFFAARRDRSARIAMSVLAVPMLLVGLFVDPFLAGFVVAATVLLWTAPASAWFAGRNPEAAPRTVPPLPPLPRQDAPAEAARPAVDLDALPPPAHPQQSPQQPPAYAGYAGAYPSVPVPPAPARRPVRALVACLLAGGTSALLAGFMVLTAFVVQSSRGREELSRLLRDNPSMNQDGMSVDQLARACVVVAVLIAVWAAVAVVLSGFALAGRGWARIALLVSCAASGLVALGCSLVFPGFLAITAATVLTGVLLVNPGVRDWYAGRAPSGPPRDRVQPPASPW